MTDNIKKTDVLDDIKDAEKRIKAATLVKTLPELKDMAREVLVLKKKIELTLEKLGVSDTDSKRIIDFVNSLVTLSESEILEIREEVRGSVEKEQMKAEKSVLEQYGKRLSTTDASWENTAGTVGGSYAVTYSNANAMYSISDGSNTLAVRL